MDPETYRLVHETEETHWFFVGRREIIFSFLRSSLPHDHTSRILDVGCGTGANLRRLPQFGHVTAVDFSPDALQFCRSSLASCDSPLATCDLCCADAGRLPFAEATFDVVTALDLVEHLADDVGGLREFARVLRPAGMLVVSVPAYQVLWSDFDVLSHHYRRYGRRELAGKLAQAGFRVEKLSHFNTLLFLVVLGVRTVKRLFNGRWTAETELNRPPAPVNAFLAGLFASEATLLKRMDFPFGVSLLGIARKATEVRGRD